MKNIFVYIISAVLLFGVIAVYAAELMGYGLDLSAVIAIVLAMAAIIILSEVMIGLLSKRLYDRNNKKNT